MYERFKQGDKDVHRDYTPDKVAVKVKPKEIARKLRTRRETDEHAEAFYSSNDRRYMKVFYEDIEQATLTFSSTKPSEPTKPVGAGSGD